MVMVKRVTCYRHKVQKSQRLRCLQRRWGASDNLQHSACSSAVSRPPFWAMVGGERGGRRMQTGMLQRALSTSGGG